MTFSSLQPGVTVIQLAHLNELLNGLNAILAVLGKSAMTWQDVRTDYLQVFPTATFPILAVNVPICAVHILALRREMESALGQIGIPHFIYTDDLTTPTLIKTECPFPGQNISGATKRILKTRLQQASGGNRNLEHQDDR